MSNWKDFILGEIINVKHGYAFKGEYFSDTPTLDILLTPGNFNIGGGFKQGKLKYYSGDYPISYKLNEGDIIVTMTDLSKEGDTLGYSAKIPKHNKIRYLHNQRIGLLQFIKDEVSKDYIYWILRSRDYQKFIINSATGSTVKHTSPSRIGEYRFTAPDLPTQIEISEILSSLDDKIELNNKINQELEILTRTLFKQWFIDFEFPNENGEPYKLSGGEMAESELGEIPKVWEVTKISTLDYKLQTGTRPKGGVGGITSGVPSIGAESVKGLGFYDFSKIKYVSNEFASKMKRGKVDGYELLIYKDGGKPGTFIPHFSMFGEGFPFETFFINEHVFLLDFFDKAFNSFCYFYFDSEYVKPVFENNGGKAAIPGINQEDVKNLLIFRPDNEMVKVFGEFAKSSITTILKNCKENIQLSNLRDELLPKLISGELKINEINN
jgi:type I restriction enzyme S subunit